MQNEKKHEVLCEDRVDAIDKLGAAIEQALEEAPVSDVLSILVAAFVGVTVEMVRREGEDVAKEIKIDGGAQRDVTIHAPKSAKEIAEFTH